MFHLKIFLLITIATKACLAEDDWQDFLQRGLCDRFNEAIANYNDRHSNRRELYTAIQFNYTGDFQMAENINECISQYRWGDKFNNTLDKMKCYMALHRALSAKSQRATDVSLKIVMSMSDINATMNTTFQMPERKVLEDLMKQYKSEALRSMKTMCFDKWVVIISPAHTMRLGAVTSLAATRMWPLNRTGSYDTDNSFKWYITERKFRAVIEDGYYKPVIDVILTNVEHDKRLISHDEANGVIVSNHKDYHYWWTAEFLEWGGKGIAQDIGLFHIKSKATGKYIRVLPYIYERPYYSIAVAKLAAEYGRKNATAFIIA